MNSVTVMKTFHGNLTPKSPPQILRDRDASFSSYLQPQHNHHHTNGSDRCKALDDSTNELSIFDAHKYFNEVTNNENNIQKATTGTITINNNSSSNSRVSPLITNNNNTNNNIDMASISIPEKSSEIMTETTRYSSASSSVDGYNMMRNYRARSFHAATPTASSEASWNSQTGLLSHPRGAIPVPMITTNPADGNKKVITSFSKPIWFLRKKCPCSGKKSVQVKEPKITQIPPPQLPHQRDNHHSLNLKNDITPITPKNWVVATNNTKSQRFQAHQSHQVVTSSNGFTFPVLNPNSSNSNNTNIKKLHVPNGAVLSEKELDPARDSLEVFQPNPNNDDSMEMETSRVINHNAIVVDEDAESDASSDLFEIESFSTTTATTATAAPAMYHRRDFIMDEASSNNNNNNDFFFSRRRSMDERSTAATECYAPSEASIAWSVTTAAAEAEAEEESGGVSRGNGGEKWKKRGSSLVSCRSEKAVSVGKTPQPVRGGGVVNEGQRGATANATAFCSASSPRLVHVSVSSNIKTGGIVSVNKPPLERSNNNNNTHRLSLAFAT